MAKRERLDLLLVERGLVESRSLAQRLVMAGQVRVSGQVARKPSQLVERGAELNVDWGPRYVSRGGEKLQAALDCFSLDVEGLVCADVGASTGGFTDCLLQHRARRVYAIDVGYGQLHWRLRQESRVVSMERTNARTLTTLPEEVQFVTIDASFISLNLLLPTIVHWLSAHGDLVALVKPQFEAGRERVPRGGVVQDPEVHRQVLEEVAAGAARQALNPQGLIPSPLLGPKGNLEFLLWCRKGAAGLTWPQLSEGLFPE